MVSSPVADLLNESNVTEYSQEETFEQENTLENKEGKTLEIYRFLDDGVKMVSVNGYKLPLVTLLEMVGVEEDHHGKDQEEDHTYENFLFITFLLSMAAGTTCLLLALIRV
jgi:hypothetical protein